MRWHWNCCSTDNWRSDTVKVLAFASAKIHDRGLCTESEIELLCAASWTSSWARSPLLPRYQLRFQTTSQGTVPLASGVKPRLRLSWSSWC